MPKKEIERYTSSNNKKNMRDTADSTKDQQKKK